MTINLSVPVPTSSPELKPRITVIGVGGAGGNAVNNMIQMGLEGVEFVVANSDAQALSHSSAERRIQMGAEVTRGLGAGSNPSIGQAAAEESLEEILAQLHDSNMVFVTAGLGGGTGTGAAPVIAKSARDHGILTVGVVTKPFQFEGANRMKIAEDGLAELQQYVDTLLVIPNQNLFRIANEKTTFADAFKMADDVLYSGVRGVTDLMVMPGLINLDFADIKSVMSEMGKAMMGTGEAEGERRAIEAAEAAIANPLLDDTSMSGAQGVLINITAGSDITLFEVDEAANRIRDEVAEDANIIFGSTFEESLEGRVRVSVVATGIESAVDVRPKPAVRQIADPIEMPMITPTMAPTSAPLSVAEPASAQPKPLPGSQQISAVSEPARLERDGTQMGEPFLPAETSPEQQDLIEHVAAITETSAPLASAAHQAREEGLSDETEARGDVFIPAPPAEVSADQDKHADPFAAAELLNARNDHADVKPVKKTGLSLFERVTGVALGERRAERKERVTSPPPLSVQPAEVLKETEIKPVADSFVEAVIAPESSETADAEPAVVQSVVSAAEKATTYVSSAPVTREETTPTLRSEPASVSETISESIPEPVSQIDSQTDPMLQPECQPRSDQVFQPEIVSDTDSPASSESGQGLSLEQDVTADIEEPALIEDLPPESILGDPQNEEDLLDIPAFLRRQAN